MMSNEAEKQQIQQALAGDLHDGIVEAIRSALLHVHTATVGHVVGVSLDQQTVKVQPGIKRITVDGKSLPLPICADVPIIYPGGALTFDISTGDECLLICAERCIDRWWKVGGVQEPAELRFHDLSDGFALIGPNSLAHLIKGLGAGTELRLRDGSVRIALRNGMVLLGTSTALGLELTPPVNGVVLAEAVDTLTELPRFLLGGTSMMVLAKP